MVRNITQELRNREKNLLLKLSKAGKKIAKLKAIIKSIGELGVDNYKEREFLRQADILDDQYSYINELEEENAVLKEDNEELKKEIAELLSLISIDSTKVIK